MSRRRRETTPALGGMSQRRRALLAAALLVTSLTNCMTQSLPPLLETNTENSSWSGGVAADAMLAEGPEAITTWSDEPLTSASTEPPAATSPPLKRPLFLDHPHLLPPGGQRRYGPFFEDGPGPSNVTARVGSTILLDCSIGMLQDKTVTWLQRKEDSIHLLTVGRQAYSSDARFSLNFRYPNNWRLQILFVSRRDEATYECQVATHPPRVRQVVLRVSAPELHVMDEHGHAVWDRYYKVGSRVELLCEASRVQEPPSSVEWRQGGISLAAASRNASFPARPGLSVTTGTTVGQERVRTTLTLQRARKEDSGNYTCAVADIAEATVTVHILNGELPAAVQHGTSGQAPVTPLLGLLVLLAHVATTCRLR